MRRRHQCVLYALGLVGLLAAMASAGEATDIPNVQITGTLTLLPATPPEVQRHPLDGPGLRILYCQLTLADSSEEQDRRIVAALDHADWFTHVMLVTLSWEDRPDAVNHPLVREAVWKLRASGTEIVWTRWLWPAWRAQSAHYATDADFYAAGIARLKQEAVMIGAVGTAFDVEPYGRCAQKEWVNLIMADAQREAVALAVREGVQRSGPVDFVLPSSSSRSTWYGYALGDLGRLRLENKTYYTVPPRTFPVSVPAGYSYRLDLWGANVGAAGDLGEGPYTKLTVEQALALPDLVARRWPEARGVWIYADHKVLPEVLEELARRN